MELEFNCGPHVDIDDLEEEFLSIEDTEGNSILKLKLSTLGIKECERDVFPECDEGEAAAYILDYDGRGLTAKVRVDSDVDLSKLSVEEIQNNITIEYTHIHFWDEDKDITTETIITDFCFFGKHYDPQEASCPWDYYRVAYYVKDVEEDGES